MDDILLIYQNAIEYRLLEEYRKNIKKIIEIFMIFWFQTDKLTIKT